MSRGRSPTTPWKPEHGLGSLYSGVHSNAVAWCQGHSVPEVHLWVLSPCGQAVAHPFSCGVGWFLVLGFEVGALCRPLVRVFGTAFGAFPWLHAQQQSHRVKGTYTQPWPWRPCFSPGLSRRGPVCSALSLL